jgi:Flp pilus assembly protein TadD
MDALPLEWAKHTARAQPQAPGIQPDLGIFYRDQAIQLSQQDRFAEAESAAREALRHRPEDVDITNELGVVVWRQGRSAEAEEIYRRALELAPDDFRVLTNLGLTIHAQGRLDEAAAFYHRALAIKPDTVEAVMNLGVVFSNQGDFDQASEWLEEALRLRPDSADALQNIGMNLGRQGRWHEAINYYERALAQRPEFPEVHRNLAYALLCCGDYVRGWPEHEWRLKCKPDSGHRVRRTFWNGDDFRGRTILLHAEQGYGDTLQFIRYAPMVKRRGGQVMVLCPAPLLRLVARCEGVDLAFDASSFVPDAHLHAPLLSLGAIFGTTLETLPARVPYLTADPVLVEHWRTKLAGSIGIDHNGALARGEPGSARSAKPFLIGIAWQGNPAQGGDNWRSFPLAQFAPVAQLPGVRLFSVQVEHGLDQLDALAGRFAVTAFGGGTRRRDFMDTAAIMAHLDLVISPDTAVAHLAGSLGVRTWVGLCSVGDWRYPHGRDDTPWYPTMRVFRQPRFGDWAGVFQRMTDTLARELRKPGAVA